MSRITIPISTSSSSFTCQGCSAVDMVRERSFTLSSDQSFYLRGKGSIEKWTRQGVLGAFTSSFWEMEPLRVYISLLLDSKNIDSYWRLSSASKYSPPLSLAMPDPCSHMCNSKRQSIANPNLLPLGHVIPAWESECDSWIKELDPSALQFLVSDLPEPKLNPVCEDEIFNRAMLIVSFKFWM